MLIPSSNVAGYVYDRQEQLSYLPSKEPLYLATLVTLRPLKLRNGTFENILLFLMYQGILFDLQMIRRPIAVCLIFCETQ